MRATPIHVRSSCTGQVVDGSQDPRNSGAERGGAPESDTVLGRLSAGRLQRWAPERRKPGLHSELSRAPRGRATEIMIARLTALVQKLAGGGVGGRRGVSDFQLLARG